MTKNHLKEHKCILNFKDFIKYKDTRNEGSEQKITKYNHYSKLGVFDHVFFVQPYYSSYTYNFCISFRTSLFSEFKEQSEFTKMGLKFRSINKKLYTTLL